MSALDCIMDLLLLLAGNFFVTFYLKQIVYAASKSGRFKLNSRRLCELSFLLFVSVRILPLSLQLRHSYSVSSRIIAFTTQLYHNLFVFSFLYSGIGKVFYI